MEPIAIDPWSSEFVNDYDRIIQQFQLQKFDAKGFNQPNQLMRRGLVFAGRDLQRIADCIANKKPYYALTGIMPTAEKVHLGTQMVVEQLKYFQDHGAKTYILIADLESAASRGVSFEDARRRAMEFHIPAYLALGLDAKKTIFYFQSQNTKVMRIAFEAARKITLNEFRAAYGSAEPGRILSSVTQIGDMLFPQLEKPMPGIIPVGIDQEPHIRLARDYLHKDSSHKNMVPISSIYHEFMPSLDGSEKMSKSRPDSFIELPESAESVCKKIKKSFSGGQASVEEQRSKGGNPDVDIPFQLLRFNFEPDDQKLEKIRQDYVSGKLLSGELKEICCEKATAFMKDFSKKLEKNKKIVHKLHFLKPE